MQVDMFILFLSFCLIGDLKTVVSMKYVTAHYKSSIKSLEHIFG